MIADDFTGAMDAGAQFARARLVTRLALGQPGDAAVEVISTSSRELAPEAAARRCREVAQRLAGRALFKKIDSTLRGPVGAEIGAVLAAGGLSKALVCPAAPAQGRSVRNGQLFVHGVPLHESAFRDDPAFPARHADLSALLGRTAAHISIEVVRRPGDGLAQAVAAAPPGMITADAETPDDLARLCRAGLGQGVLLCGAFGLAAAWAEILAGGRLAPTDPAYLRERRPVLVISGSAHPATGAQIRRLAGRAETAVWPVQAGLSLAEQAALVDRLSAGRLPTVSVLCPATVSYPAASQTLAAPEWRNISRLTAQIGAAVIRRARPAALLVIGGETANHLFDALGTQAVTLLGEAAPGIPCGRLAGGAADGLALVTKAGGFGNENSLEALVF